MFLSGHVTVGLPEKAIHGNSIPLNIYVFIVGVSDTEKRHEIDLLFID